MLEMFKNLTKLIKNHDDIIIMTHKNPDLDGLSSAICLYQIIKSFDKKAYIYMPTGLLNKSITKMFNYLEKNKLEIEVINSFNYKNKITSNTLLIILDVNKINLLENPKLLNKINDVVVIDHHIKGTDYLKNTKFSYINENLSSIAEFVVSYNRYLNKTIDSIVATILLAGIEIDTNGFNIKTNEFTFEAAAYLTKMGADNIVKQELKKENKEAYVKRQQFIKKSYMINGNMIMCTFDNNIYSKQDLAIIAKDLLNLEGVEASFVIGKTGINETSISARSIGNINVQKIMDKLGGGGHATEAAAQKNNTTISNVKKEIIKIINKGGK